MLVGKIKQVLLPIATVIIISLMHIDVRGNYYQLGMGSIIHTKSKGVIC